jgi:hypothetical protein
MPITTKDNSAIGPGKRMKRNIANCALAHQANANG